MLYDLCLHRKACAECDWIRQAWQVHGHQANADTLQDDAFERVVCNECGCLARRLYKSEWTIGAVRGKEGSAFAARRGWCRWFVDRDEQRCRLGLQDALLGFLGGNTLKTGVTHSQHGMFWFLWLQSGVTWRNFQPRCAAHSPVLSNLCVLGSCVG